MPRVYLDVETRLNMREINRQAQSAVDKLVGQTLIWKHAVSGHGRVERPYAGRRCEVRKATYDEYSGEVMVIVKTVNHRGGFLEDNDAFHRTYRCLSAFEPLSDETVKKLGLSTSIIDVPR